MTKTARPWARGLSYNSIVNYKKLIKKIIKYFPKAIDNVGG